jgi:hypothetical protein
MLQSENYLLWEEDTYHFHEKATFFLEPNSALQNITSLFFWENFKKIVSHSFIKWNVLPFIPYFVAHFTLFFRIKK